MVRKISTPLIFVNFKTYASADGEKAVKLARVCERVSKETGICIAVAVDALDLRAVAKAVSIPVFAEHVDCVKYGAHTGWIVPEAVKKAGAVGTLINHAEHQLPFDEIACRVQVCKELKLSTCVCASTPAMVKKIATLKPDFIAYEPPALIGGDISVSTSQPGVVKKVVDSVKGKRQKILCGAGVKTSDDVRIALKLGTKGVLLASGVTKANNPRKVLLELISGIPGSSSTSSKPSKAQ